MKRNVRNLLLGIVPLLGILMSSCSLFPSKKSSSSSTPPYTPTTGEPEEPDVVDNNVTAIHMKRTKDFFMQRTEVLDFNVTFDNAGSEDQKGIKWESSAPGIVRITENQKYPEKSYYCTLTALREGTAVITARSLFSSSLTASVSITVIDNSDYTYFWQKNPDVDENKYFNDDYGRPKTEGTVTLGGIQWGFKFDKAPEKVGGGQALKFGSKNNPFGALHFEAENSKDIRKISVLCSSSAQHIDDGSAHGKSGDVGTSNITIKVGETTYVDNVSTPKNSNDSSAELDTITGGIRDTNPMNGKIQIDFSPTFYDDPNVNSGAIYLKAIIIEYYRGDLVDIEITEVNEYANQFYVGTAYDKRGIDINAYFSVSATTKVNVTHLATFSMSNIDEYDCFIDPETEQNITASYTYVNSEGISKTVSKSYEVSVAPRIKEITVEGELEKDTYLDREELSYKGLLLRIYSEGISSPIQSFDLENINDVKLADIFDMRNVHKYASKTLQSGFTIGFDHYLSGLKKSHVFAQDDIIVRVVTAIEVSYSEEADPLALIEGAKITYDDFIAKVTYDSGDPDEFAFKDLSKQKYVNPDTGKEVARFNFKSYSPEVALKSFATSGFEVVLKSTLNDVSGSLKMETTDFSIVYLTAVELTGTPTQVVYEECDDMNYGGINVKLTYSNETSETKTWDEAKDMKVYRTNGEENKLLPLFNAEAPTSASTDLISGFDMRITSYLDSAITATLRVDNIEQVKPVEPRQYERLTKASDFIDGGKYIITCLDSSQTSMKVWNGDLAEADAVKAANYFTISQSEAIGNSVTIKSGKLSRAVFVFNYSTKEGDTEPVYSIKHIPSSKYIKTNASTSSPMNSTNTGDYTRFFMSFNDTDPQNVSEGSIGLRTISVNSSTQVTTIKYLKFNETASSDRFGGYDPNNSKNVNIQIFRLVEEEQA